MNANAITARTKTDSTHRRPVVVNDRVVGHVAQEPPTAGTVREWVAYDAAGRRLGTAGTRALAEGMVAEAAGA